MDIYYKACMMYNGQTLYTIYIVSNQKLTARRNIQIKKFSQLIEKHVKLVLMRTSLGLKTIDFNLLSGDVIHFLHRNEDLNGKDFRILRCQHALHQILRQVSR